MPDYSHLKWWWERQHLHDDLDEHVEKWAGIGILPADASSQRKTLEEDVRTAWQQRLMEWKNAAS